MKHYRDPRQQPGWGAGTPRVFPPRRRVVFRSIEQGGVDGDGASLLEPCCSTCDERIVLRENGPLRCRCQLASNAR